MTDLNKPSISVVIPLYNEEENIPYLHSRLVSLLDSFEKAMEVIFIDDGSNDQTAAFIRQICLTDNRFQAVFLSRNFGHQLALSAGLSYVRGTEGAFIIDGDLQDPPELLHDFYPYLNQGYEVVYAVRKKRETSLLMNLSYKLFYRIMRRFSYIQIPLDSGDFSLISRRVVDIIQSMPEESRFIRGLRSWVGFRQIGVEYSRQERNHGESKYSLVKLISLALNGFFNFSKYPIRLTFMLGFSAIAISGIYFLITMYKRFFTEDVPSGFTAIIFLIILFGGIQLIAIGIIGEYILKIFFQVKNRPLFLVKDRVQDGRTLPN